MVYFLLTHLKFYMDLITGCISFFHVFSKPVTTLGYPAVQFQLPGSFVGVSMTPWVLSAFMVLVPFGAWLPLDSLQIRSFPEFRRKLGTAQLPSPKETACFPPICLS